MGKYTVDVEKYALRWEQKLHLDRKRLVDWRIRRSSSPSDWPVYTLQLTWYPDHITPEGDVDEHVLPSGAVQMTLDVSDGQPVSFFAPQWTVVREIGDVDEGRKAQTSWSRKEEEKAVRTATDLIADWMEGCCTLYKVKSVDRVMLPSGVTHRVTFRAMCGEVPFYPISMIEVELGASHQVITLHRYGSRYTHHIEPRLCLPPLLQPEQAIRRCGPVGLKFIYLPVWLREGLEKTENMPAPKWAYILDEVWVDARKGERLWVTEKGEFTEQEHDQALEGSYRFQPPVPLLDLSPMKINEGKRNEAVPDTFPVPLGEKMRAFDRSLILRERDIDFEVPHPDALPIDKSLAMRIKELVLSYLGEHHPEWIGFYELRRINRRAGLIEVEVKPVQAFYDMALGLRLIIDPERCEVIHLFRKEEMVDPKPTGIISQEEAFQRIAPHLNARLYYGVKELTHAPNADREEAQVFPVYQIESHYLVDAISGRLVRME